MGYRSEVALTMKREDVIGLIKQAEEKFPRPADADQFYYSPCEFIKGAELLDHKNGYLTLHWDWVKWYDSYPEVDFVTDFYNGVIDEERDVSFKRIGENYDDYEEHNSDNYTAYGCVEFKREFDTSSGDGITFEDLMSA